jgi:RNA polymerase sigma-70 factor (ECF subfamily)
MGGRAPNQVEMGAPAETSAAGPAAPELGAIYAAQVTYVWETLQRLGVRAGDVEDIAHDVFITVHRRLTDYDPGRPIRPWIFGICLRFASDYRRSARIRREVGADAAAEPVDRAPRADDQLAQRQARQLVLDALSALPLEQRAVFVLHELDGVAMPEIAVTLDAPLNTLYSRLRLARKQFVAEVRRRAPMAGTSAHRGAQGAR